MHKKAIVFDLDGSLIHTPNSYIYQFVGKVLRAMGLTKVPNEDIDKFWFGMDREKVIKQVFHQDSGEFWRVFKEMDSIQERLRVSYAYPDTQVLDELLENGYFLGIVTGAPLYMVNAEIALLGREKFHGIVIANGISGIKPKPHPHGLEECLSQLGVDKSKAVYVGNGEEDVLTAREAGVLPVLINRGEFDYRNVFSPGFALPKNIVHSLYEVKDVLREERI